MYAWNITSLLLRLNRSTRYSNRPNLIRNTIIYSYPSLILIKQYMFRKSSFVNTTTSPSRFSISEMSGIRYLFGIILLFKPRQSIYGLQLPSFFPTNRSDAATRDLDLLIIPSHSIFSRYSFKTLSSSSNRLQIGPYSSLKPGFRSISQSSPSRCGGSLSTSTLSNTCLYFAYLASSLTSDTYSSWAFLGTFSIKFKVSKQVYSSSSANSSSPTYSSSLSSTRLSTSSTTIICTNISVLYLLSYLTSSPVRQLIFRLYSLSYSSPRITSAVFNSIPLNFVSLSVYICL